MPAALLVFLGGGLGAVSRWGLSAGIQSLTERTSLHRFPLGILACNLLGCLLVGALFGCFAPKGDQPRLFAFAVTGFLGGFTTFSTFGKDTHQLIAEGFNGLAIANVLVSTLGGVALVLLGYRLAHSFH